MLVTQCATCCTFVQTWLWHVAHGISRALRDAPHSGMARASPTLQAATAHTLRQWPPSAAGLRQRCQPEPRAPGSQANATQPTPRHIAQHRGPQKMSYHLARNLSPKFGAVSHVMCSALLSRLRLGLCFRRHAELGEGAQLLIIARTQMTILEPSCKFNTECRDSYFQIL